MSVFVVRILSRIICLLLTINIAAQVPASFSRIKTIKHAAVDDIAMMTDGSMFISLQHNSGIYSSNDQGKTWLNISDQKFKLYSNHSYKRFFTDYKSDLYCAYVGNGYEFQLYRNNVFSKELIKNSKFNPKQIFYDSIGNYYYNAVGAIRKIDNQLQYIIDSSFYKAKSYILDFYLYDSIHNYIIESNITTTSIYKLNTKTKASEFYSKLPDYINPERKYINQAGDIWYVNAGNLYYINHNTPKQIEEIKIDTTLSRVYGDAITLGMDHNIYVMCDIGVYQLYGSEQKQCRRLHQMSNQLPFPIGKTIIRDSLYALLMTKDDCMEPETYHFNAQQSSWKKLDFDLDLNTIRNLRKDNQNTLYANFFCNSNPKQYIKYSEDDGNSWYDLLINGIQVHGLDINKDGNAVALAGNSVYVYDDIKKDWIKSTSKSLVIPKIDLLYFYASSNELLMNGEVDDNINNRYFYYLFHSVDGGLTWTKITSIQKSENPYSSGHDYLISKSGRWYAYGLIVDSVRYSDDQGRNWIIDRRFDGLRYIQKMIELADERLLLSAYYNKVASIYVMDFIKPIEKLNDYFYGVQILKYDPPSTIYGFLSGDKPMFVSKDLGKTIVEIDHGLAPYNVDVRIPVDILQDNQKNIYVSCAVDGLYKADAKIINNSSSINKTNDKFYFAMNSNGITIVSKQEISLEDNYEVAMVDVLGRTVIQQKLNSNNTLLVISLVLKLPMVIILIYKNKQLIQQEKFVFTKIN